ncbi:ATP-dependent Clp protease ATP-binding subunit [Holzapfeliella sp. JNUCC 72]
MANYSNGFSDFDALFDSLNRDFFSNSGTFSTRRDIPIHSNQDGLKQQTQVQNPQQQEQSIGIDLVKQAKENKYDPVIGRDSEVENVIEILSRRNKNNPVLVGPAGVGKTAIVEGLAQRIAEGNVPERLKDAHIIELNINELVAGSSLRGAFEEKLQKIIDEASKNPNIILFIDEIHNIVGAGSVDSENNNGDAANILKPALARGDLSLIGATTTSEFQRIEKDPALARRLQEVKVGEPSVEEAIQILEGLAPKYESYHHVKYDEEAIKLAVTLSKRYIQGRYLPDKAIDLLDEAGAKKGLYQAPKDETQLREHIAKLEREKDAAVQAEDFKKAQEIKGEVEKAHKQLQNVDDTELPSVTAKDMYQLIEQKTKISMSEIHADESQKSEDLVKHLKDVVIDQDEAIDTITDAIARKKVFKDENRPTGSFLFAGPTGVGKTELAKQLAKSMFGSDDHFIRLDMSEYQDKTSVNKLIGSAPGYIGYQEGGQLTEQVRHQPYSLILMDEIEKANPDIFNALLQIMDDGRLTDAQGRTVSFKDTILIMTSNAGYSDNLIKDKGDLMKALEVYFRPEFLNRLDAIVPFNSLKQKDLIKIVDLYLDHMANSLEKRHVKMTVSDEAKHYLVEKGYDEKFGARPLRRVVEQDLQTPAAKAILADSKLKEINFTVKDNFLMMNNEKIAELPKQEKEEAKVEESKLETKEESNENYE